MNNASAETTTSPTALKNNRKPPFPAQNKNSIIPDKDMRPEYAKQHTTGMKNAHDKWVKRENGLTMFIETIGYINRHANDKSLRVNLYRTRHHIYRVITET